MAFELPPLTYAFNALEPHIDAKTMEIHHDKHHGAYVTNLNKALEGNEAASWTLDQIMKGVSKFPAAVRNNGGGHYNHTMFWLLMKANGGGDPSGNVKDAIVRDFGKVETFKEQFANAGMTRFGSGWAWLIVNSDGKLQVTST